MSENLTNCRSHRRQKWTKHTITNVGTTAFFVDGAYAQIDATPRSVPEGGSAVALLGIALAGLEGLRRRFHVA